MISSGFATRTTDAIRKRASSSTRARAVTLALIALTLGSAAAWAAGETAVRVERIRPHAEKHVTLRFLRENVDFIRAALDRTRSRPISGDGKAIGIDPRFLAYRDLLASVALARDSVTLAEDARRRRELLRSVTELGDLEAQLDQLDRLLAEQRVRLGVLQKDFTGDQRTALAIVLSGYPVHASVSRIALTLDDGLELAVPLSADQLEALRQGGAVQIFHGFVEPREQVVQVALTDARGSSGDAGFVTLDPPRDRLTMLRLDLSAVHAGEGAPALHASTWLNDARTP
jgi:hypothetical protein